MRWMAAVTLLFCGLIQANPLVPHVANYVVTHGRSQLGSGQVSLQQLQEDHYEMGYSSDVGWLLLKDKRDERSQFKVTDGKLVPLHYQMERSGSGSNFSAEIEFDGIAQQIHARYKDRAADFHYELPIFDNISYLMQLRLDIAAGKTDLHYQYIVKTGQRNIKYEVIGPQQLTVPYGTFSTIKVARIRTDGSNKETFAWLVPELNYAIAQIQHYEDGELKAGMALQQIAFNQPAVTTP